MAARRVYADTNVIIRYLTNDPIDQAETVEEFLAGLDAGDAELYVCDLVAAEAVYVLQSFYERPREEIADRLKAFYSLPGVVVEHRRTIQLALDLYTKNNVDFTDAYLAADAKINKTGDIFTFDKDFTAFDWLTIVKNS